MAYCRFGEEEKAVVRILKEPKRTKKLYKERAMNVPNGLNKDQHGCCPEIDFGSKIMTYCRFGEEEKAVVRI